MHGTDNRSSKVAGLSQMISTKTLHANLRPVQLDWNNGVFHLPLRLDFEAWNVVSMSLQHSIRMLEKQDGCIGGRCKHC